MKFIKIILLQREVHMIDVHRIMCMPIQNQLTQQNIGMEIENNNIEIIHVVIPP